MAAQKVSFKVKEVRSVKDYQDITFDVVKPKGDPTGAVVNGALHGGFVVRYLKAHADYGKFNPDDQIEISLVVPS